MTAALVPETVRDREIARCLAIGYTWDETAKVADCSRRTVARSAQRLAPWIEQIRGDLERELHSGIYANVALALDVERRMLTGEIDPDDKRYLEASKIARRFTDRLFIVDRGPALPTPGPADPQEPELLQLTTSEGGSPAPGA